METAKRNQLASIFSEVFLNGMAWTGAGFIAYGFIVVWTGEQWRPLESVAVPLSSALTIIGTLVTAASIYGFSALKKPRNTSLYGTAPAVIVLSLLALWLLWDQSALPPVMVNGFAILAIAGNLLRLHPGQVET
ncbi:MAG: hypothetical protein WA005_04095 [Candidatus Binataceae bacterium]